MSKCKSLMGGLSAVPVALFLAVPAHSQGTTSGPAATTALDEIVVTARKREETLQDVPLAVSAITADQIQLQGIKSIEDAIQNDPSLNFDEGFAPGDNRIVIRGLSPTRGRPNVATLVDGIDISSESVGISGGSMLVDPRLLDIERIEVVKGPQSALYGRSAFAGAIQYITKDPAKEFEALIGVEAGNLDTREYRMEVSAPLGDKLGFRIMGLKHERDSGYHNVITGGDVGGSEGQGAALSLKFEPTDSLNFKARYEYSDDEFEQPAQAFLGFNAMDGVPASASSCVGGPVNDASCPGSIQYQLEQASGGLGYFDDMSVPAYVGSLGDAKGRQVALSPDFARSTDGGNTAPDYVGADRQVNRASLVANWDVSFGRFTSLTGYTDATVSTAIDLDKYAQIDPVTGNDISPSHGNLTTETDTWQNSQELRFTSDFDGPVNFITGLQYWKEHSVQQMDSYTVIGNGTICMVRELSPGGPTVPFAAGCDDTTVGQYIGGIGVGQYIDDVYAASMAAGSTYVERDTEHRSGYLQVSWDITDRFRASIEGRYVNEHNSLRGPDPIESTERPPAGMADGPTVGPGSIVLCGMTGSCEPRTGGPETGVPNSPRGFGPVRPVEYVTFTRRDSYFTPRVSLDWSVTDDALLYLSYAEGQKPGGFSTITVGAFGIDGNVLFDDEGNVVDEEGNPTVRKPDDIQFDPEKIKEYTLGWKTAWRDRSLVFNGAVFFLDFTDKQVSSQRVVGNQLGNVLTNAGGAEIRGLEAEVQWRPIPQLTLGLGYTYLDAEYTDYVTASNGAPEIARVDNCVVETTDAGVQCLLSRNGNRMEDTPEHAVATQITWRDQLGSTGLGYLAEFGARYQSKRYLEDDNSAWLDAYWLADMRVGLEGDNWSVVAFVDNLFDDDTIRSAGTGPGTSLADFRLGMVFQGFVPQVVASPLIPTITYANMPDPRRYGLRVQYKF